MQFPHVQDVQTGDDMAAPQAARLPRPWAILFGIALACAPLIGQAEELSGLRILPHAGGDYSFRGWHSQGEVPAALSVPLEIGEEIHGATLQLQPARADERWRVLVQYETSLILSADGPHLDLTGWKHCLSEWEPAEPAAADAFVLPTPTPEQQACFPGYTPAELELAVRAQVALEGDPSQAERWLADPEQVSAFAAISTVRVRVEVLRKGRWVEVTTVTFLPTIGC